MSQQTLKYINDLKIDLKNCKNTTGKESNYYLKKLKI